MAIVVDKEKKRKDIALSCKELLIASGLKEPTISDIAKTAGIGKGTFYEYFNSKEELLFELVNFLMAEYNSNLEVKLKEAKTTKDKVKVFAGFFYKEESKDLRVLYKMFTGISLLHPKEEMKNFQSECFDAYYLWFEKILADGVAKGEIVSESINLAKGMFATAKGLFIASETTDRIDNFKAELDNYTETIFKLIEVK